MLTQSNRLIPNSQPAAFGPASQIESRAPGFSTWQIMVGVSLFAACLRVAGLGAEPFWKNEFFSVYWSAQPAWFLASTGLFTETNPPLYFLMLKFWMMLFGTEEAAVRSLSALASTLCVPLIFMVGRGLAVGPRGDKVGLVAAVLMAVAPVQLYFAHEARVYAFLPLLVLLAMLGLITFLRHDTGRTSRGLALYVVSGALLLYAHGTAVFVMTALNIAVLLYLVDIGATRRITLRFLAASAVIGLLALPALAAILTLSRSPNIEWMAPFGLDTVLVTTRFVLVGPLLRFDMPTFWRGVLFAVECGVAFGGLACVTVLARRGVTALMPGTGGIRNRRMAMTFIAVFPLLFLAIVVGVSVFRPVLIPRIAIWLTVPFAIAAGFAWTGTAGALGWRAWPRVAMLGLLIAGVGLGQWDTVLAPSLHKPDMPGYVRDFRPHEARAETVFVGPHTGPLGVRHYAGAPIADLRVWWPKAARPVTTADHVERGNSGAIVAVTDDIAAALRSGGHGQLVLDDDDQPLLAELLAAVPELAGARRHAYASLVVLAW